MSSSSTTISKKSVNNAVGKVEKPKKFQSLDINSLYQGSGVNKLQSASRPTAAPKFGDIPQNAQSSLFAGSSGGFSKPSELTSFATNARFGSSTAFDAKLKETAYSWRDNSLSNPVSSTAKDKLTANNLQKPIPNATKTISTDRVTTSRTTDSFRDGLRNNLRETAAKNRGSSYTDEEFPTLGSQGSQPTTRGADNPKQNGQSTTFFVRPNLPKMPSSYERGDTSVVTRSNDCTGREGIDSNVKYGPGPSLRPQSGSQWQSRSGQRASDSQAVQTNKANGSSFADSSTVRGHAKKDSSVGYPISRGQSRIDAVYGQSVERHNTARTSLSSGSGTGKQAGGYSDVAHGAIGVASSSAGIERIKSKKFDQVEPEDFFKSAPSLSSAKTSSAKIGAGQNDSEFGGMPINQKAAADACRGSMANGDVGRSYGKSPRQVDVRPAPLFANQSTISAEMLNKIDLNATEEITDDQRVNDKNTSSACRDDDSPMAQTANDWLTMDQEFDFSRPICSDNEDDDGDDDSKTSPHLYVAPKSRSVSSSSGSATVALRTGRPDGRVVPKSGSKSDNWRVRGPSNREPWYRAAKGVDEAKQAVSNMPSSRASDIHDWTDDIKHVGNDASAVCSDGTSAKESEDPQDTVSQKSSAVEDDWTAHVADVTANSNASEECGRNGDKFDEERTSTSTSILGEALTADCHEVKINKDVSGIESRHAIGGDFVAPQSNGLDDQHPFDSDQPDGARINDSNITVRPMPMPKGLMEKEIFLPPNMLSLLEFNRSLDVGNRHPFISSERISPVQPNENVRSNHPHVRIPHVLSRGEPVPSDMGQRLVGACDMADDISNSWQSTASHQHRQPSTVWSMNNQTGDTQRSSNASSRMAHSPPQVSVSAASTVASSPQTLVFENSRLKSRFGTNANICRPTLIKTSPVNLVEPKPSGMDTGHSYSPLSPNAMVPNSRNVGVSSFEHRQQHEFNFIGQPDMSMGGWSQSLALGFPNASQQPRLSSADDLNMKIASVRKMWDSSAASTGSTASVSALNCVGSGKLVPPVEGPDLQSVVGMNGPVVPVADMSSVNFLHHQQQKQINHSILVSSAVNGLNRYSSPLVRQAQQGNELGVFYGARGQQQQHQSSIGLTNPGDAVADSFSNPMSGKSGSSHHQYQSLSNFTSLPPPFSSAPVAPKSNQMVPPAPCVSNPNALTTHQFRLSNGLGPLGTAVNAGNRSGNTVDRITVGQHQLRSTPPGTVRLQQVHVRSRLSPTDKVASDRLGSSLI